MPCAIIFSMTLQTDILSTLTSDYHKQMIILKSFSLCCIVLQPLNAVVIAAMPRKHRDELVISIAIFWDQRHYSILNGNKANTRNDKQSGPEVIKLFSCSTQLSITF